jgi:hypothetical protein
MKKQDRRRLAQAICKRVPGLRQLDDLLVLGSVSRLLRGFYLENSSRPAECYVWVFVLPLYVPGDRVSFNLGQRVGGGSRTWGLEDMDTLAAAVSDASHSFLGGVNSPGDIVTWGFVQDRSSPAALEAVAYSLIAAGQIERGVSALRDFATALATDGRDWVVRMRLRAEELADAADNDPAAAAALLSRWEDETTHSLGLHKLAEERA